MVVRKSWPFPGERVSRYAGLRMSAAEFLAIEEDGERYELLDGVVVMSPRPQMQHQRVLYALASQFDRFLERHAIGEAFPEIDVRFTESLVYSPDLCFVLAGRVKTTKGPLTIVPDLIVEILSPNNPEKDLQTKRHDYERFGVSEYWVFDQMGEPVEVLRLNRGAYLDVAAPDRTVDAIRSHAIEGFVLDVAALRRRAAGV